VAAQAGLGQEVDQALQPLGLLERDERADHTARRSQGRGELDGNPDRIERGGLQGLAGRRLLEIDLEPGQVLDGGELERSRHRVDPVLPPQKR